MTDWKSALARAIDNADDFLDARKQWLMRRLGLGELCIVSYLGHGTRDTLYLKGRVLRDKHITGAIETDSMWRNLLNMYKRYESDEIPWARVQAGIGTEVREVEADKEGYFYVELHPGDLAPDEEGWYAVQLRLLDYPGKERNPAEPQEVTAEGRVVVPGPDAQFGVISDIDDTVMRTDVLDLVAMARNTFLMNARTRLPFEGVAAFYQALRRSTGPGVNPIYYVSSSSWNLYDMLHDFFVVRGVPVGPMFLTDLGFDEDKLLSPSHHDHKLTSIQTLLDTHATLPFILIGDSGQKDPEIYLETVERNPGRILAVYIRDVTPDRRDSAVAELAARAARHGVEMLAVKDTVAAAVHASTHGWIDPKALPGITTDTLEDKQAPTPLEEAVTPGVQADTPRSVQTDGSPEGAS